MTDWFGGTLLLGSDNVSVLIARLKREYEEARQALKL